MYVVLGSTLNSKLRRITQPEIFHEFIEALSLSYEMRKRSRPAAPARVSSRPLSVPGKEAGQGLRDLFWGVLLDEVPALLDELELRARDLLPQSRC